MNAVGAMLCCVLLLIGPTAQAADKVIAYGMQLARSAVASYSAGEAIRAASAVLTFAPDADAPTFDKIVRGYGRALIERALEQTNGRLRPWAHGELPEAALMAERLDPTTFEVNGPVSLVAADVAPGYLGALVQYSPFSASSGVLAFVGTRVGSAGQLKWFDRAGRIAGAIEPPQGGEYLNPAISPNGERDTPSTAEEITAAPTICFG